MDLKSCPFCGSADTVLQRRPPFGEDLADDLGHIAWVECGECGCRTRQILHYNASEIAKVVWNRREQWRRRLINFLFNTRFRNNFCITILVLSGLYIAGQVVRAIFFNP